MCVGAGLNLASEALGGHPDEDPPPFCLLQRGKQAVWQQAIIEARKDQTWAGCFQAGAQQQRCHPRYQVDELCLRCKGRDNLRGFAVWEQGKVGSQEVESLPHKDAQRRLSGTVKATSAGRVLEPAAGRAQKPVCVAKGGLVLSSCLLGALVALCALIFREERGEGACTQGAFALWG